ncbi:MAG TPA: glycine cleavage system aminomethyltransferase GcvT [Phenylobacterium sp.]
MPTEASLKTTLLTTAHVVRGAKMVPFAGYSMPVQYADGVLKEHLWTREHAGAFDVSHMGPAFLNLNDKGEDPEANHKAVAELIEPLVCGDIRGLKRGQLRYTLLLDENGGVLDDLMIGRPIPDDRQGNLYIVVNAGTKDADFARIEQAVAGRAAVNRADGDCALIALQGPKAVDVVKQHFPEAAALSFMTFGRMELDGTACVVARSGYTGEDGFEILAPQPIAERLWSLLLGDERVRPIGLGARDSLRLEAGLPLYGHDLDESVSPVEAGLSFALSKRRRKKGNIPGAARIEHELTHGPARVRVGLRVEGAPAREGAEIADEDGQIVGRVTSGGYAPSLSAPIAMGFVPPLLSEPGTALKVVVRGRQQPATVTALPFVSHRYVRTA